jgi:Carboxypeptidase regulatory-like domain
MVGFRRFGFWSVFFLSVMAVSSALAQSQQGTIVGRVVDTSKAAVVGAKIEVTNPELGVTNEAITNEEGLYTMPYLRYGTYNLSVVAAGFKKYNVTGIQVATATTTTVNAELSVAELAAEVNVQASAAVLESNTSTVGTAVEEKLKDDLPVINRRDPFTYVNMSPGVSPGVQGTIGGGRFQTNSILLDGQAPDTNPVGNGDFGAPALPSVESIGEFKLLLNSIPAEYGRTGGPVITFATRSGTNEFHGAAYEYHRNSALDARPWQAGSRGSYRTHYFGIAGGGPVVIPGLYNGRQKSFFFADYSDTRTGSAGTASGLITVPTEAMRRGDFSAPDILPIYDVLAPFTDAGGQQRRQRFSGNIIPLTRLSRVSRYFLDRIPLPNRPGSINNFVGTLPASKSSNWLFSVKGDHYLSTKDRISGFYQGARPNSISSDVLGDAFGNESEQNFNRIRLDWSRNWSPAISQQILYGVTRQRSASQSRNFGENLGQAAGLQGLLDPNCPRIEVDRAQQGSFTMCFNLADTSAVTNQTFNYSLLWNRGKHTIKTGFDMIRFNTNENSRSQSTQSAAGHFNFGGIGPRGGGPAIGRNTTSDTDNTGGNSFADFFLGLPTVAHVAAPVVLGHRQTYIASYIQDDWKMTSKLTVNAGLRWDLNIPFSELRGQITRFDATRPNPGAAGRPGALVYHGAGPGTLGSNRVGEIHKDKFAPRLGFAYQYDEKTVIRGFGGVIYAAIQNVNFSFADRTGYQASGQPLVPSNPFSLYYNWDTPFPQSVLGVVPNTNPAFRNGQSVSALDPKGVGRPPTVYMYSLGVQRELKGNILLDVTYLANQTRHAQDGLNLNYLDPQYWTLGALLNQPLNSPAVVAAGFKAPYAGFDTGQALYQALLPFPQYTGVGESASSGTSASYHAAIIKAQKRFSSGLSFLASYTVSKFITDSQWAPGGFGASPRVANNRKLDKGLYRFDVPQRLVLTYSYELPFGKSKKFLGNSNKAVDAVFGGWTISGLQQYQGGAPGSFSGSFNQTIPTIGGTVNRIAGVPLRSNISCGDMVFGDPQRNYLFNAGNAAQAAATGRPLAFAPAGDFQVGNNPRIDPQARQCGRMNEDVAISKTITFREKIRLQLGAEAFNLLNRHTWVSGAFGQGVTAANFGEIVPDQPYGPRQIQVRARLQW